MFIKVVISSPRQSYHLMCKSNIFKENLLLGSENLALGGWGHFFNTFYNKPEVKGDILSFNIIKLQTLVCMHKT